MGVKGFKNDKDRIPEIDTFVENNQTWTNEDFEAKIIHIPGHTTGHISFHFFNENHNPDSQYIQISLH